MRDDVTIWHHLSLAGRIHKMIPACGSMLCSSFHMCIHVAPSLFVQHVTTSAGWGVGGCCVLMIKYSCMHLTDYMKLITAQGSISLTIAIQIWLKFCFAFIWIRMEWSLQNFAHVMWLCAKIYSGVMDSNQIRAIWNLVHWGPDKMAAISQTPFSNAFSWMKMYEFWLELRWSLFLRVQ